MTAAISLKNVTKAYGPTIALSDLSVDIEQGEIIGLVGENGAGKSTFVKLISGAEAPTSGEISLAGDHLAHLDTKMAYGYGIRTVYQEGSLIDGIPLYENLLLHERCHRPKLVFDKRGAIERATVALQSLGLSRTLVRATPEELSPSQRQIAEVARCVVNDGTVAILDEPTSSLSVIEARRVLDAVRRLRDAGLTVIYVSHVLEEVFELCDRVIVFRDGVMVDDRSTETCVVGDLVDSILGRRLAAELKGVEDSQVRDRESQRQLPADIRSADDNYALKLTNVSWKALRDITFEISPGEIVGVSGIEGSGKSLLGRLIAAREPLGYGGTIAINGREIRSMPRRRLLSQVGYLAPDRAREGINALASVGENLLMGKRTARSGFLQKSDERQTIARSIAAYNVRCRGGNDPITSLSGGNQQKVLLSRAYLRAPSVVVLDEPTRGIDVGARESIYKDIREKSAEGTATLVISNEPAEIAALADRVVVMRRGAILEQLIRPSREDIYEATVS